MIVKILRLSLLGHVCHEGVSKILLEHVQFHLYYHKDLEFEHCVQNLDVAVALILINLMGCA